MGVDNKLLYYNEEYDHFSSEWLELYGGLWHVCGFVFFFFAACIFCLAGMMCYMLTFTISKWFAMISQLLFSQDIWDRVLFHCRSYFLGQFIEFCHCV